MNAASHFSLLVIDDEPDLRALYELTLLREGYELETAGSVEEAWELLAARSFSAVITDMRLPDGSGLDLLHRLEQQGRREKTIVITAYGSAESAVEALKAGAYDYLTKPVDLKVFRSVVASALGRVAPQQRLVQPEQLPSEHAPAKAARPTVAAPVAARVPAVTTGVGSRALARMAGASQAMQQVRALIEKVGRSMAPVLVHGESGTGKELVARAIHDVSVRAGQPFIAVNCGAIPEQLLEAEFFGYRKGAFTGANEDRDGFFQAARGGTLFLDEIGDLPLSMQSKLLRSIQERSVRAVGATNELPLDVRIISATHKNLAADVQSGRFRQDLYYRLNVIQIKVPPLRDRLEDLPLICERVLERIAAESGIRPPPRLTREALGYLLRYPFGGNVRELENLLHRAVAMSDGQEIDVSDLDLPESAFGDNSLRDERVAERAGQTQRKETEAAPREPAAIERISLDLAPPSAAPSLPSDLAAHLDGVERDILVRALERHRNNRTAAGASLGLSLRQMRYRMARLGVVVAGNAHDDGDDAQRTISGDFGR
ncbi:MAG TPA: sigma-54 dependent transcriptional regulator [Methylibium sp.]|uniref:sigma-54-dependent transcriptional regulator n=1 Tax=Methylibium sp. TaxID=2067992 RepID=UPI002DBDA875|nr:sigma-54 dependent transcriptional regulator [Methylibium sp.]HEU4457924.1 sigma-54 dependent transcriptional regulator [Methylibium sp.]